MTTNWNEDYLKKVIKPENLKKKVSELKEQGLTIATINGTFDLMHAGHLHILYEASKTADCLILALNSDESVKKYKSLLRPIIPLSYRLQMMAALSFVDYVTWFHESDPREVLEIIRPDVHVNGAEYGENCIEAEVVKKYGGTLHLVERIDGLSTSEVIQNVIKVCDS